MSWFQLDSPSVLERFRATGTEPRIPSLGSFLLRGICGFTLLSSIGFAPWVFAGHWFSRTLGEAGLYCACAFCFIGSSGLLLHRLIIGPGSLLRFYKLFGLAFTAYSLAWIVCWMSFRGHRGGVIGLVAGAALMGCLFARAFDAPKAAWRAILAIFALNAAGYFGGGWLEGAIVAAKHLTFFGTPLATPTRILLAKLLWGICYGVGFGAGLGLAFYFCQASIRSTLRTPTYSAKPNT